MGMPVPLDVLVQVDAEQHAEDAQETDLEAKAQRELQQNEVDGQGGTDPRREVCGKDGLNRPLRGHDPQNFPEDTAEQPANQQEYQQQPGGFSHVNGLLNC